VTSPVRWTESVERLLSLGATTFVEVGPGKVLTGLIKSINRDVRLLNVEDLTSLNSTIDAIKTSS